jgi:hypothetical protein
MRTSPRWPEFIVVIGLVLLLSVLALWLTLVVLGWTLGQFPVRP